EPVRRDPLLAKDVLAHLAGDGPGQVVDDLDVVGHLEVGDPPPAVVADLLGRERRAGPGHDPRGDDLAVLRVGQTHDSDLGDGGVVVEVFLDLGRIDVLAASYDQLLAPADDLVIAVGAAAGEVAGGEPAFGVDGPRGRLGGLVIAGHHDVAADAEL